MVASFVALISVVLILIIYVISTYRTEQATTSEPILINEPEIGQFLPPPYVGIVLDAEGQNVVIEWDFPTATNESKYKIEI